MTSLSVVVAALLVSTTGAFAQNAAADQAAPHPDATASAAPASAPMAEGEVRKVDKDAGKVTLRHGPIASLDMPGMTMVFRVADPKMLDDLKKGEKVRFAADRVNGALTVTRIEIRE